MRSQRSNTEIFPIRLPRIIFLISNGLLTFEGNTGPYILYTIVRIKSILNKYKDAGKSADGAKILPPHSEDEKALMLEISRFNAMMENAL